MFPLGLHGLIPDTVDVIEITNYILPTNKKFGRNVNVNMMPLFRAMSWLNS